MVYMYNEKNTPEVELASEFIVNNILRFIYGVHWGFTISKMREENLYKVSFRSTKGFQTVRKFAVEMGGGGHDLAAGAETEADTIEEAIENVLKVVSKLKD
jgi:nanoRNase/pAp phosphatase (c-di-AMP/oligoRNAs hydrolase)